MGSLARLVPVCSQFLQGQFVDKIVICALPAAPTESLEETQGPCAPWWHDGIRFRDAALCQTIFNSRQKRFRAGEIFRIEEWQRPFALGRIHEGNSQGLEPPILEDAETMSGLEVTLPEKGR